MKPVARHLSRVAFAAAALLMLGGCVYAPPRTGVVYDDGTRSGSVYYDDYYGDGYYGGPGYYGPAYYPAYYGPGYYNPWYGWPFGVGFGFSYYGGGGHHYHHGGGTWHGGSHGSHHGH
jgi:hypothetical protein